MYVDFSLALNTIILHKLVDKLNIVGLATSVCLWIMDFLAIIDYKMLEWSNLQPQPCIGSPLTAAPSTPRHLSAPGKPQQQNHLSLYNCR